MAKKFMYAVLGLLALLLIALVILTITIDSIVKSNIESIGTEMTGTAVTVSEVSISPFSGEGTITGFRIANPEGFGQDNAMEIAELFISMDVFTIFSDEIIIHELLVTEANIYVEQKLPDNNLAAILNSINRAVETGTEADADMIIEYFLLENGSVDLFTEIGGEREERVEIETIEMRDLGRVEGRQHIEAVVNEIAEEVFREALQAAARSGFEQFRDAIRDIFN